MTNTRANSALSLSLRVLDLSEGLALQAGRLLVGLGADVIRLPRHDEDLTTSDALHWHVGQRVTKATDSLVVLDQLLDTADVVIDSGSTNSLRSMLMRESDPSRWESVIHVVVTPFGLSGPRSSWRGDGLIAAAAGGMAWMGGDPGKPPQPPPRDQASQLAGTHAAIAALLGVIERQSSGQGQIADISAQQAVAATLETGAISWIHGGSVPARTSGVYAHVAHRVFASSDGHLAGGYSGSNRMWSDLLAWMVEEACASDLTDPRWEDQLTRWKAREHVDEVVGQFVRRYSTSDFAEQARERALPWAAVTPASMLEHNPQLVARDYFVRVQDGPIDVGFPFESIERPRPVTLPAPRRVSPNLTWEVTGSRDTEMVSIHRSAPIRDKRPMAGLRVLDLTWVLAGPYMTKTLAEHGADIIKVESLHRQDPTRFAPSMRLRPGASHDESGYFVNFNRNKRSLALNLRTPDGLEVLHRLVSKCDMVVENFSPGVLEKWGLSFDEMKVLNPKIILVSMAGVGQTGPWRSAVTFADTLAAMSGLTYETGGPDGPPQGLTFGLGDMVAANAAVLGALDLVRHGIGGHIDLSQLEAMASHMGSAMLEPAPPTPQGVHGIFPTLGDDRWIAISTTHPAALLEAGAPDSLKEVDLASWTAQHEADDLASRLQGLGVPAYPVRDGRDLVERDPQLSEREAFLPLEHPLLGDFLHEGIVVNLDRTPGRLTRPAPLLGQHTVDLLTEVLGMTRSQIDELIKKEVLE